MTEPGTHSSSTTPGWGGGWAPPQEVVEHLVLNQPEVLPYYLPYGPPPLPPPRGSRAKLIVGIGAAVFVVLAIVAAAGVFAVHAVDRAGKAPAIRSTPASAGAAPSTTSVPVSGGTNLDAALSAQSAALIAGNQAGWLSAVDPEASAAIAEYTRIFHNLRQMKVASWQQVATYDDLPVTTARRTYSIDVDYCLIKAPCNTLTTILNFTAELQDGQVRIETFAMPASDANWQSPLPWLVSNLSAMTSGRVIVAAGSAEQGQLTSALQSAVQAAAIADQYAHWGKPDVYLVYLAGAADSSIWFGQTNLPSDTAVSMDSVATQDIEMVMHMPDAVNDAGPGGLTAMMRWAMGIVALDYGADAGGNNTFANGMATYIQTIGHPNWIGGTLSDVRSFVRSGKWSKSVYLTSEFESSSRPTRSAAEGIGYLAMRRLIQRFGLAKTLEFWGDVERLGYSVDKASSIALNLPWQSVNADCVNYIEHQI